MAIYTITRTYKGHTIERARFYFPREAGKHLRNFVFWMLRAVRNPRYASKHPLMYQVKDWKDGNATFALSGGHAVTIEKKG